MSPVRFWKTNRSPESGSPLSTERHPHHDPGDQHDLGHRLGHDPKRNEDGFNSLGSAAKIRRQRSKFDRVSFRSRQNALIVWPERFQASITSRQTRTRLGSRWRTKEFSAWRKTHRLTDDARRGMTGRLRSRRQMPDGGRPVRRTGRPNSAFRLAASALSVSATNLRSRPIARARPRIRLTCKASAAGTMMIAGAAERSRSVERVRRC